MTLDSEWDRVKENPDNLIVSDSLREMLGSDILGNDNGDPGARGVILASRLTFKEYVSPNNFLKLEEPKSAEVTGTLLSFTRGPKEWRYVFEVRADLLSPILMCGPLHEIYVSDQSESFKHELQLSPDDPEPEVSFELQGLGGDHPSTSALLTVTVAAPTE